MKIPLEIIDELEKNIDGLNFGRVNLEILIHDKKPRFRITKETSFIPGKPTSGSQEVSGVQ